ncbi:MAG: hypothetical protein JSV86_04885 [Gemmatimonadota bacterium]|nr:MAG: hypothetical protein JSV86_04885 [Gemmatimonadota bacterium]
MPPSAHLITQNTETEGQEPLVSGGVSVEATASQDATQDFVLPTALHLQGAHICWQNCEAGDYAYVDIRDPSDTVSIGGYNLQAGNPGPGRGYWQLLGTNSVTIWNQFSKTAQLPQGVILRAHLVTTAAAGTRKLAINFMIRLPL